MTTIGNALSRSELTYLRRIAQLTYEMLCESNFAHDQFCNLQNLYRSKHGCNCGMTDLKKAIDDYRLHFGDFKDGKKHVSGDCADRKKTAD